MPTESWKAIVVAVRDPGARKQTAIRKAARIAASTGARITLFHAFSAPFPMPTPMPTDPKAILRIVGKQRREQLLRLARPLRAKGLEVQCEVVWDFPPAHAIVRHVLAEQTGPGGGGVASPLAAGAVVPRQFGLGADPRVSCPVWFVKQERLAKQSLVLAAIDPTHAHAKPVRSR